MANGNFIVQNGLQIGPLVIDAETGSISTTGNISTTGTTTTFINEVILGTEAVYGTLTANSGATATSTTTGAVQVDGGIGVTKDVWVGGNVHTTGTAYLKIPAGNNAERPGAPSLGMIRYNSDISSYEGFGAGSAWSSLGGVKSVDGFATITAEASAGAGDDVLRFYSGSTGSKVQVAWASAGNISILPTTAATSSTSGALQVAGGVGIAGATYIGGATTLQSSLGVSGATTLSSTLGVTGAVTLSDVTASASTTTGALTVAGGVGIAGATYIGGVLNVAGTLVGVAIQSSAQVQGGSLYTTGTLTAKGSSAFGVDGLNPATTISSAGVISTVGNIVVTSGVDMTTTSTGALILTGDGGLSVGGNAYVGNNLYIGSSAMSQQVGTPAIVAVDSNANYAQIAMKNSNSAGSADYAAYADSGTDESGWADMGMSGSAFSDGNYTITKPMDGYFLVKPVDSSYGGNLVIATSELGNYNDVVIGVGSFHANAEVARFHGNATTSGYMKISTGTASTNTTSGALQVTGGVGVTGAAYIGGVLNAAGATTLQSTLSVSGTTTAAAITASGAVQVNNTLGVTGATSITNATPSTSISTGALVVAGGVGVAGDMFVGGTLTVANLQARGSSSITVQDPMVYFQANVVYPWTYDTGMYSDSIGGPANTYVHHGMVRSISTGVWGFFSNVESEPASNINWGDAGLIWDKIKSGEHVIANTTASTSTTTGALQVAGGAGIVGATYLGSTLNVAGHVTVEGVTSTGATGTGNFVFSASPTITGHPTIEGVTSTGATGSGDLVFSASPTLSGTLTTSAITASSTVQPNANASVNLGSTTNYWNNLYAASAYHNTITVGAGNGILPAANASVNIGSASSWFNVFYGKSTQAQYADLAENYQADKPYPAGTVVMFGGSAEVTIADVYTTAVAGVVSTNPAHLMNGGLTGSNVIPLALQGRVPCMVIGPVKKGDMLVSAGFGYARATAEPKVGTVIGKALEDFASNAKGVIEVVVGRV